MEVSRQALRQIIREEYESFVSEGPDLAKYLWQADELVQEVITNLDLSQQPKQIQQDLKEVARVLRKYAQMI